MQRQLHAQPHASPLLTCNATACSLEGSGDEEEEGEDGDYEEEEEGGSRKRKASSQGGPSKVAEGLWRIEVQCGAPHVPQGLHTGQCTWA